MVFLQIKKDIVIYDDDIGISLSLLTLSYMIIVGKDVCDIVIHIIALVDETYMLFGEEIFYGPMISHILKIIDS